MPTALSTQYFDAADVQAILSQIGFEVRFDDDTIQAFVNQYVNWICSRINDYCAGRYNPEDLAQSWTINYWGAVMCAHMICARKANPYPTSLKEAYQIVQQDMREMKQGIYTLADVDLRVIDQPAWSNVRVPVWYLRDRIRVERPLSEGTPRRVPPNIDRLSELMPKEP